MSELKYEVNIQEEHLNKEGLNSFRQDTHFELQNQTTLDLVQWENKEESEGEEEVEVDSSIESFKQQAKELMDMIDSTALNPDTLETKLNALRKSYYKLAKLYHPDRENDEDKKISKIISCIYIKIWCHCHMTVSYFVS